MEEKNTKSKLNLILFIALLPSIIFGLYKNGLFLYMKGNVNLISALKPLIIILMCTSASILGLIIRDIRKNKKLTLNYKDIITCVLYSMIVSCLLPVKSSPFIIFITSLIFFLFDFKKTNKIALLYTLILLINTLVGLGEFRNSYEINTVLNYTNIDKFIGFISGGICSTSTLAISLGFIILLFCKLYKKDLVISAVITFFIISGINNIVFNNYENIFPSFFSNNVLFMFVFVLPVLESSPYTIKGQTLFGTLCGLLTVIFLPFLNFYAPCASILILSSAKNIIDRIFIIK